MQSKDILEAIKDCGQTLNDIARVIRNDATNEIDGERHKSHISIIIFKDGFRLNLEQKKKE